MAKKLGLPILARFRSFACVAWQVKIQSLGKEADQMFSKDVYTNTTNVFALRDPFQCLPNALHTPLTVKVLRLDMGRF